MEELQARAWEVIEELSAKHTHETVAVVSHLFTILAVVTKALEMPLRNFRRIRMEPGAMVRIELGTGGPQVTSTNETRHLRTRGRDTWRTVNRPDGAG